MDVQGIFSVLADHGFSDTSTQRKLDIVNDVVWDVCTRENWPFMEKSVTLTFNGSTGVPTNYPTDVATVLSVIDTINGTRLYPTRVDDLRGRHSINLDQTGFPYYYYFPANIFTVYPTPSDSTQTLLFNYIFYPAILTSTSVESAIKIPPRFHSVIWFGALAQLYDLEDDPELAVRFETKFERKFQTMRNQIWRQQTDRPDTIEILDTDDFYT